MADAPSPRWVGPAMALGFGAIAGAGLLSAPVVRLLDGRIPPASLLMTGVAVATLAGAAVGLGLWWLRDRGRRKAG